MADSGLFAAMVCPIRGGIKGRGGVVGKIVTPGMAVAEQVRG